VWFLDVGTPVTTTNGDDGEFGGDDGTSDSGGYFLGALDTETDVSVKVTDGDERLESGSLTGRGLLLYGSDVHDLILQGRQELVDNLVLLDGEREEVAFLQRLDLSIVDETTKLGDRDPCLLLVLLTTTTTTTSSSSTVRTSSTTETTSRSSSASGTSSTLSHDVLCVGVEF